MRLIAIAKTILVLRIREAIPQGRLATATFSYDAKNRQIARSINGLVTFSVWDDWELVEEYTTGNVRTAAYLQGAHGPVKSLLNDSYYFYQDSLGSTSHIADATGHLLEYYKYDLYGKPTYWNASGTQITASAPANNVRDLFSGERWISELGLYDLRNRYYSPDLGRFLQPDPIGFKGDASNLYRYCGNDWANRTDPMGLYVIVPIAPDGTKFTDEQMKQIREGQPKIADSADKVAERIDKGLAKGEKSKEFQDVKKTFEKDNG